MGKEKMDFDPKLKALEFILTIDLTIDDLRKLQTMLRSIVSDKMHDVEPDRDWYNLLKRIIERRSNLIAEQAEPVEDEFIQN